MTVRVMVVDDSAFFRQRITEILNADELIEVVATAVNGAEAIEKVSQYEPDVITMDVEMPVMDGITAVRRIMETYPTPILMFSTLTTDDAKTTLDALDAGAVDFLPKRMDDISTDRQIAEQRLCKYVRVFGSRKFKPILPAEGNHHPAENPVIKNVPVFNAWDNNRNKEKGQLNRFSCKDYKMILIGASAGGPVALQEILRGLPRTFPLPILIVQHMPASFTPTLAKRLDNMCDIHIKQASDGDVIESGCAILAPGGYQMVLGDHNGRICVRLREATQDQTYMPSVDITFSSVAEKFTGKILVIMLTGMGSDGCAGTRLLKEKGSTVWAQDETTSVVYGMPMAIVEAGLADTIMPLPDIGATLFRGM